MVDQKISQPMLILQYKDYTVCINISHQIVQSIVNINLIAETYSHQENLVLVKYSL